MILSIRVVPIRIILMIKVRIKRKIAIRINIMIMLLLVLIISKVINCHLELKQEEKKELLDLRDIEHNLNGMITL